MIANEDNIKMIEFLQAGICDLVETSKDLTDKIARLQNILLDLIKYNLTNR